MKNLRYLIAFAICLGMAGIARADQVDFQMNVLDPALGGIPETLNTFPISFSPCSAYNYPSAPSTLPSTAGCFEGINATEESYRHDVDTVPDNDGGEVWTKLVMTFYDPNNILGLNNGNCGTLGGTGLFSATNCTEDVATMTYTLIFTGGEIVPGQSFFIAENGVTPDAFPHGTVEVFTAVPEPNSILLLSTGAAMFGLLIYSERRRMLPNPIRS